jgi:hypothetical protein
MSQTAHGPSLPALVCLRKISGCDHGNPSQWRDWHRCKNRAPNRDRGLSRQRRQVPPRRSSPPGEIGERSPEAMTVRFGPCLTRYVLGVVGNSGSTDDWVTSRFAQRTSHDQKPRGGEIGHRRPTGAASHANQGPSDSTRQTEVRQINADSDPGSPRVPDPPITGTSCRNPRSSTNPDHDTSRSMDPNTTSAKRGQHTNPTAPRIHLPTTQPRRAPANTKQPALVPGSDNRGAIATAPPRAHIQTKKGRPGSNPLSSLLDVEANSRSQVNGPQAEGRPLTASSALGPAESWSPPRAEPLAAGAR